MRLIEQQMNNAIRCNQNFSKGNTVVINIGTKSFVYLHGNHIATVGSDFLQVFDGGWQSNTTKSRLNALINEFADAYMNHPHPVMNNEEHMPSPRKTSRRLVHVRIDLPSDRNADLTARSLRVFT